FEPAHRWLDVYHLGWLGANLPPPNHPLSWKLAFNPSSMSRVLVRATNWLGDAVMSLPAIRAIRGVFPHAHLAVAPRSWVADLYAREKAIDCVISYPVAKGWAANREFAARLRAARFDGAILLQTA